MESSRPQLRSHFRRQLRVLKVSFSFELEYSTLRVALDQFFSVVTVCNKLALLAFLRRPAVTFRDESLNCDAVGHSTVCRITSCPAFLASPPSQEYPSSNVLQGRN